MEQQIRGSTNNPILCTKKRPQRGDGTFKIAFNSKSPFSQCERFCYGPYRRKGGGIREPIRAIWIYNLVFSQIIYYL